MLNQVQHDEVVAPPRTPKKMRHPEHHLYVTLNSFQGLVSHPLRVIANLVFSFPKQYRFQGVEDCFTPRNGRKTAGLFRYKSRLYYLKELN